MMIVPSPLSLLLMVSSAALADGFLQNTFPSHSTITTVNPTSPIVLLRMSSNEDGESEKGNNWMEKSFPVSTSDDFGARKVEDYNLGISGKDFQTGPLGARMYEAMISRAPLELSDEIRQAYLLYAMDFTAKEATKAALSENGFEMVLKEEEEDQGMWGITDAVRLYSTSGEKINTLYNSIEEAVTDWTPGQTFDFVVRQVPAKLKEMSLDELVQALDPDGALREEAKEARGDDEGELDDEALLSAIDDGISSLAEMATDNVRRTEEAPRGSTDAENAFSGYDNRGYRIIKRSDLLQDSINDDGTENEKSECIYQ